ncbi:MAG: hypothetical protein JSR37_04605 [Verrucomicrobia bacterium]|nr:hypothetical protein [Verrucomicrobiota bacterium]MBS0637722.1 hypothetical protein [Verrucomicrobiota bacterium]
MAKIDFNKVEQNLHKAMHTMFVKNLVSGKESSHKRAVIFFGHHLAKPSPADSVIEAINEWRIEQALSESIAESEASGQAALPVPPISVADEKAAEDQVPSDQYVVSPLYILRKHLLWFIRKRVANIYKLLGTTKEEVVALRKKKELTAEDKKRVEEILAKANEINQRLMKKLGLDTDEALVETEVKKHKSKRFNIRDSWLPL